MSLKNFHKEFGAGVLYAKPKPDDIKALKSLVDEELLEEFEVSGWRSYVDGALWLVNPLEFTDSLKEWFPKEKKKLYVFARSAFGDLLIAKGKSVFHLHVHYGKFASVGDDIDPGFFFDMVISRKFVKNGLQGTLAAKAVRKFGPLAADEMFTFEPALALGGAEELKYVVKVKMMPQLSILSQLH